MIMTTDSTTSTHPNPDKKILLEQSPNRKSYRSPNHDKTLRNNLLPGVGYLELANAGDFAANVWNEIPVPRHAVILMAIGGPIALLVSIVAARDFSLSWRNLRVLFAERRLLREGLDPDSGPATTTRAVLSVNTRELGTELIDRLLMDAFLGFGVLLVGTGTIMAIWGADRRIFHASNLLSGFVGNGFTAVFGVINAVWCGYLVYRFEIRYAACRSEPTVQSVQSRLRRRFRRMQWHFAVNGVNGLVAGMASMVTARMWWGYVVLIPCVALMIAGNVFWRKKLGYDRPVALELSWMAASEGEKDGLGRVLDILSDVANARESLQDIAECDALAVLLRFIADADMLEPFGLFIARVWPDRPVFEAGEPVVRIGWEDFKNGSSQDQSRMAEECRRFLSKEGRICLEHRERYLLELVGEIIWIGRNIDS
ncbi:hypothetical protein BJX61DRAFT_525702 [Aspergillus egyptiacus]|nr:hypothetical protein BJX61DRAFT_525702 [Aspergillus egyptiacus]